MGDYQGSLLGKEYYDGSRLIDFKKMVAEFNGLMGKKIDVKTFALPRTEIVGIANTYDSYLQKGREVMGKHFEYVRSCYIMFAKTGGYRFSYTDIVFQLDDKDVITVPLIYAKSFLYRKMYSDLSSMAMVVQDIELGIEHDVEMYPIRKKSTDGQMKIMVDAVLAVDAIDEKYDLKILIVGSSHEPTVVPRSAYGVLPYMVTNSTIDMYDPLEEEGSDVVNSNVVNRFRKAYDYSTLEQYDLVIDDAWSGGEPTFPEKKISLLKKNFSIKSNREIVGYNHYYQVSYTHNEVRVISRTDLVDYNSNDRLGSCSFCSELRYRLKDHYSDRFYQEIFDNHKPGKCKNSYATRFKEKIKREKQVSMKFCKEIFYTLNSREYMNWEKGEAYFEGKVLRRLITESTFFAVPTVEMRHDHLSQVHLLVVDYRNITNLCLCCKSIIVYVDSRNVKMYFPHEIKLMHQSDVPLVKKRDEVHWKVKNKIK